MVKVNFKPSFVRQVKQLESDLRDEVLEKIELFKNRRNHRTLKVHKLHGVLADKWSFSVNFRIRIVFEFLGKNEAVLLVIGDHDVNKN